MLVNQLEIKRLGTKSIQMGTKQHMLSVIDHIPGHFNLKLLDHVPVTIGW